MAQKTITDDWRIKSGRFERYTLSDPDFRAALRRCGWQSFTGSLRDLTALGGAPLLATLPIHPAQRVGERRPCGAYHVTTRQEMERGFGAPGVAVALSRPDRTFMMPQPNRAAG